jgi:hypothetical protein
MNLDASVQEFLSISHRLQAKRPLTGPHLLDAMTDWYRSVRIDGATLDADGDMLLLQWGEGKLLMFDTPIDLRGPSGPEDDARLVWTPPMHYLDVTRQVFVTGGDPSVEFDDEAIQMHFTIGFSQSTGPAPASNYWIHRPEGIAAGRAAFLAVPLVQKLISLPSTMTSVYVDHCG